MAMNYIIVRSKQQARNYNPEGPWAAISITGRKGEWPSLPPKHLKGVLRLDFMDAVRPSLAYPEMKLFSLDEANAIFDFVSEVKDDIYTLLVHCVQGMSRSPAVAAALSYLYFRADPDIYFLRYKPNPLVYRTMLEAAHARGLCDDLRNVPHYLSLDEMEFKPDVVLVEHQSSRA